MFKKPLIKKDLRIFFIEVIIGLCFFTILGQLFYVQVIKSPGLISQFKSAFNKKSCFIRGDIRDRFGNLLVLDVITYDLYNNVKDFNKISEEEINNLQTILELNNDTVIKKLHQKINTKIAGNLNQATAKKIKSLETGLVYLVPKVTRKYPHKTLASHIVGFVNADHIGQHGVEYFYEDLLKKENNSSQGLSPFPKGTDIVLTIDSVLQQYAEDRLNESIKKTHAEKGTILIISPKTGEIFTWAVYPSFDPNKFFKEKSIKNWALTDVYEPGSTFKIFTVSSGLETMVIDKTSTFYDPGFLKVGNRTIRNHHGHKPRTVDLLELFKQSSNVASGQIGLKMSPKDFYTQIKKFKFSEKTMIDLAGESKGLLTPYKEWKTIDQATTAIGQGSISVTPLQLASGTCSIANNGLWIQPHVLKGIWEPNYMLINEGPYKFISEQILSKETANYVSNLLGQSVKENVEAMAYIAGNIPGYSVAGKTGTAQKVNPNGKGYLPGHTIASFIGYFPVNNPEILILVVIDDPKTEGQWGNTVAGPVFNDVGSFAAKRLLEQKVR